MNERDLELTDGKLRFADEGVGPPLLLLHGLGGNWQNWAANIPSLAQTHRVIAPDLPGFGRSQPFQGVVTIQRYVASVIELMNRLGLERATLIGNSLGGLLTIEAAARYPERVRAAVLVCSGGIPLTSARYRLVTIPQVRATHAMLRRPRARRAVATGRARALVEKSIVHDPSRVPEGLVEDAIDGMRRPAFAAAFDAGLNFDARVRAPQINCPTLVLWGREDRLLPVSMGEELDRLIPDSRLVVWDGTGHCPMIEDPLRFNAAVGAFSAEVEHELTIGAGS